MSRQRRKPARARTARPNPAVSTASAAGGPRRSGSRTAAPAVDAVAVYRDAAGYGRVMRGALVLALVLLISSLSIRAAGKEAPPVIGLGGALFMLFFFSGGIIKHYRGIYRVRRYHPGVWQPSARFAAGMMMAPFGIGNPRNTRVDTLMLRLTAVLAVVLVVLLIADNAAGR